MSAPKGQIHATPTPGKERPSRRDGSAEKNPEEPEKTLEAFFGLVNRKPRWSLSWKGYTAVCLAGFAAAALFLFRVHPFLAVTDRINTRTMVVEGWLDETDLHHVVEEFRRGGYDRVFTTGGPVHGVGQYVNDYSTAAHIAAQRLLSMGLSTEVVQSVPSRIRDRDRTYNSAAALRDWLRQHDQETSSFVILTQSVHARRSRLLFQRAFDVRTNIGVIAIPNPDYDPARWWRYSEGVKEVLGEMISFLYAKLLFRPAQAPAQQTQSAN